MNYKDPIIKLQSRYLLRKIVRQKKVNYRIWPHRGEQPQTLGRKSWCYEHRQSLVRRRKDPIDASGVSGPCDCLSRGTLPRLAVDADSIAGVE